MRKTYVNTAVKEVCRWLSQSSTPAAAWPQELHFGKKNGDGLALLACNLYAAHTGNLKMKKMNVCIAKRILEKEFWICAFETEDDHFVTL